MQESGQTIVIRRSAKDHATFVGLLPSESLLDSLPDLSDEAFSRPSQVWVNFVVLMRRRVELCLHRRLEGHTLSRRHVMSRHSLQVINAIVA